MAIDNRKKNFNIHGVISSQNKIQPPIMIIGNYKKNVGIHDDAIDDQNKISVSMTVTNDQTMTIT